MKALRTGDRNFSRAIETAPKAFPLVTDKTIAEGREIKVELSSQAADIESIEGVRRTLNLVIKTAENGIKKIGQDRRWPGIRQVLVEEYPEFRGFLLELIHCSHRCWLLAAEVMPGLCMRGESRRVFKNL